MRVSICRFCELFFLISAILSAEAWIASAISLRICLAIFLFSFCLVDIVVLLLLLLQLKEQSHVMRSDTNIFLQRIADNFKPWQWAIDKFLTIRRTCQNNQTDVTIKQTPKADDNSITCIPDMKASVNDYWLLWTQLSHIFTSSSWSFFRNAFFPILR